MDSSFSYGKNKMDFTIKNTLNRSLGAASKTEFEAGGFSYDQLTYNLSAVRQFDANLSEIVSQNEKIAGYVKKLESRDAEEDAPAPASSAESDLPPASELVAEIEQFLRQQRPE